MAERKEAGEPSALGFVGVHGEALEVAPARVRDVIGAARDGAARPAVIEVERQRRIDWNRRMQARGRQPCAITNAADELARAPRLPERHAPTVAADDVPLVVEPARRDLQALD